MADTYQTSAGLEKNVTENRQTENREQTEKPITEVTLIAVPMERRVERANFSNIFKSNCISQYLVNPAYVQTLLIYNLRLLSIVLNSQTK